MSVPLMLVGAPESTQGKSSGGGVAQMADAGDVEWTDAVLGVRRTRRSAIKSTARRMGLDLDEYIGHLQSGLLHCYRCGDWHNAKDFGIDRARYTGRTADCRRSRAIAKGRDPDRPRALLAEAVFRARLEELGATLLEPGWRGAMYPHRLLCAAGHECSQRPNRVQRGLGICRVCARQDPATAEAEFRARLAELGAELLEPYRNSSTPHRVRCRAGQACADITIQWQVLPAAASALFSDYANQGDLMGVIENALVIAGAWGDSTQIVGWLEKYLAANGAHPDEVARLGEALAGDGLGWPS